MSCCHLSFLFSLLFVKFTYFFPKHSFCFKTGEKLAQPGASFALIAREQIGLMQVEAGDPDAAIATMRLISEDAGVTRGLRERAQTLIVALGGDITAPAPAE